MDRYQLGVGSALLVYPAVAYLVLATYEKYWLGTPAPIPSPPAKPVTPEHDFHRAEFTALRTEVGELVKSNTTNFQYALLASGAIFAWIAGATVEDKFRFPVMLEWEKFVWLLPLFVASLFAGFSAGGLFQIRRIAAYLYALEEYLGHVPPLGWERFFRHRAASSLPLFLFAWLALLGGDFALAIWGAAPK